MEFLNNCEIKKIIYHCADNMYTVARVACGGDELVATFYGKYAEGERVNLGGEWFTHQKYGRRFQADYIERPKEMGDKDVELYLQTIKGVGHLRAGKIVSAFGKNALDVARESPEKLRELGIPLSVIENIKKELQEDEEFNRLKLKLLPFGLTLTTIRKIYKQYGTRAYGIVTGNPYKLADDISGIGFKKADDIAQKLGMDPESEFRIKACIKYVLQKKAQEGHVFYPKGFLAAEVRNELRVPLEIEKINQNIEEFPYVVEDNDNVYLKHLYYFEHEIANKLAKLQKVSPRPVTGLDELINKIQQKNKIRYTQLQIEAIKKSFTESVSIITGGPGTGKTTIIKAIIDIAERNGLDVELAAPTGKAAKRIEEVTGHPAKTIHRLLEYKPMGERENGWKLEFQRNEFCPIKADMIIVDETSMIDTVLMYYLIKAVGSGTKVVFVGDTAQLPSIGPGTVLADMMKNLPVTTLKAIFRQKNTSAIIVNSRKIDMGEFPYFNSMDFQFRELADPSQIVKAYLEELNSGLSINDVQILTPVRKTETGAENLNKLIQQAVNPPSPEKPEVVIGDTVFRVGDKVMQLVNDYEKECFNGDTGIVRAVFKSGGSIKLAVDFDGRHVLFSDDEIKDLTLAYAITVHKSQGSQFDTVIMPLTTKHFIMLKRNLFYTAVTRAKKKVMVFGQKKAVAIAVKTIDAEKRYTTLADRLRKKFSEEGLPHA